MNQISEKTKWEGLKYNPKSHNYSSRVFDSKDLEGNFKIIALKNKYHTKGDNKPEFVFIFKRVTDNEKQNNEE